MPPACSYSLVAVFIVRSSAVCLLYHSNHGIFNCTDGEYVCACVFPSPSQPIVQPGAGCDGRVGREDVEEAFGSRQCSVGDPDFMCWRWATARKTGGTWFSTTAEGYNKTWRVVEARPAANLIEHTHAHTQLTQACCVHAL